MQPIKQYLQANNSETKYCRHTITNNITMKNKSKYIFHPKPKTSNFLVLSIRPNI